MATAQESNLLDAAGSQEATYQESQTLGQRDDPSSHPAICLPAIRSHDMESDEVLEMTQQNPTLSSLFIEDSRSRRMINPNPLVVQEYGQARIETYKSAASHVADLLRNADLDLKKQTVTRDSIRSLLKELETALNRLNERFNALKRFQLTANYEQSHQVLVTEYDKMFSHLKYLEAQVADSLTLKQEQEEKQCTHSESSKIALSRKSDVRSRKSTSSSSSRRKVRLSEAAALEVKERVKPELDRAQQMELQLQQQIEDMKTHMEIQKRQREAQRKQEEAQREAQRIAEDAEREEEERNRLREMKSLLANVRSQKEQTIMRAKIEAANAAVAVLDGDSQADAASQALSSMANMDRTQELFVKREDIPLCQNDELRTSNQHTSSSSPMKNYLSSGGLRHIISHTSHVVPVSTTRKTQPQTVDSNELVGWSSTEYDHNSYSQPKGQQCTGDRNCAIDRKIASSSASDPTNSKSSQVYLGPPIYCPSGTSVKPDMSMPPYPIREASNTVWNQHGNVSSNIMSSHVHAGHVVGDQDRKDQSWSKMNRAQDPEQTELLKPYPACSRFADQRDSYKHQLNSVAQTTGNPVNHATSQQQQYGDTTYFHGLRPHWSLEATSGYHQEHNDQYLGAPASRSAGHAFTEYASQGVIETQALAKSLAQALMITRLPVPKPPVFRGDPLTYPSWIAAFEHLVSSDAVTPQDKMLILREYIDGPAKLAVGDLYYELSENSYYNALAIIKKRFGRDHDIAEALKEKLDNWPDIKPKDSLALRNYADYLQQCQVMAKSLQGLAILEDPSHMNRLVQKLPFPLTVSWAHKIEKAIQRTGRHPTFEAFVSFLQFESDSLQHLRPVTKMKRAGHQDCTGHREQKGGQTFATASNHTAADEDAKLGAPDTPFLQGNKILNHCGDDRYQRRKLDCAYCNDAHYIGDCIKFAAVPFEVRKEFALKQRLCFKCLRRSHRSKDCRSKVTCNECKFHHVTIMHDPNYRPSSSGHSQQSQPQPIAALRQPASKTPLEDCQNITVVNQVSGQNPAHFCSLYIPVYVSAKSEPHKELLVYAMLDTMSDTSFVTEAVAEALNFQERDATLTLSTLTSAKQTIRCKMYSDIRVRAYNSKDFIVVPAAYSQREICVNRSQIPTRAMIETIPHLKHLSPHFQPLLDAPVALLLGINASEAHRPLEIVDGGPEQPFAQKTRLGWGLLGEVAEGDLSNNHEEASVHHSIVDCVTMLTSSHKCFRIRVKDTTNDQLVKIIERDFACPNEQPVSQEDQRFLHILREGIRVNEAGHYELPLPFKKTQPEFPNNRHLALKRLMSLKRRFQADPEHFQRYTKFIDEMLERGDAEIIPVNESPSKVTWYIPHHGIYNPNKPGKIRVVFDCASRCQGTSLNDHLLTGPDLMNSLVGVLCRFRLLPIAISCDVERMFHQFHVAPQHRDYLRFLWWPRNDLSAHPVDFRMKVHLFGAASSPGCANFALKQLAKDHCELHEGASEFIQRDFYVDDGLQSDGTINEAVEILDGARQICKKGNLRLHKIASNSSEVMSAFPDSELVQTASIDRSMERGDGSVERALGIRWTLQSDMLHFLHQSKDKPTTKRGVLSTVAAIFDPLGLVSPIILRGRQILQEACREETGWDQHLSPRLLERWNSWLKDLNSLCSFQIPRCYFLSAELPWSTVEFHHFADASSDGYGECSYLRVVDCNGGVHCTLVMAKSKVVPLRPITIPRLELQAAVLAVKIARFLQREFQYLNAQNHFWSDSKVALGYIYNETKRFHVFVANRVQQIREFSKPEQWHHVSTELNPADHASRGMTVQELKESNWQHGPRFLQQDPVRYTTPEVSISEGDSEVKTFQTTTVQHNKEGVEEIISRFSSLDMLICVMVRITSWIRRTRERITNEKLPTLSLLEERESALTRIIKSVQSLHYPTSRLSTCPELKNLNVMLDNEGLLRVGGRLKRSSEDYHIKHPIVLPRDSHLSLLLVRRHHRHVAHQGRTSTLNSLRQAGIWICGARRVVASTVHRCVPCTRMRGKPASQMMADLPADRVEAAPPFTHTGLDCFGPFTVKAGRRDVKRYGLILTCLACRAVHLEVLEDLSTDAFLCGLRRFVSLRGNVSTIRCDRGTNFVGAAKELNQAYKEIEKDKVVRQMADRHCIFQFNPPYASHFGGVWERMIRTVRNVLSGLLQEHKTRLTTDVLTTLFCEVAAIVNSRPLCIEGLEDSTSLAPLTPNHLLTLKAEPVLPPPGNFQKNDLYARKRWRRIQYLTEQFWSRWRKEYLSSLQPRKKWYLKKDSVQVGTVVLLVDDSAPRGVWKLARIEEVFPSGDGLVRSVRLRLSTPMADGKGGFASQTTLLERPVHKIVPLHID